MKKIDKDSTSLSLSLFLDSQYLKSINKREMDYWSPLSKIILECIILRSGRKWSQSLLAKKLGIDKSIISKFESMEYLQPDYNFICKLSMIFGYSPGITLEGNFMAVVPEKFHGIIKKESKKQNVSTRYFLEKFLEEKIEKEFIKKTMQNG